MLIGLLVLAAPLVVRAQVPTNLATVRASTYQTEYDSLQRRASAVRTRTEAAIARFKSGFAGIAGTKRRTLSYALAKIPAMRNMPNARLFAVLVKKQVVKHKTRVVEIEKVYYYGTRQRLLLYEYYEQHQLVHQQLSEYATRNGQEYSVPFRTTTWVRGDYLSLTIWPRAVAGDRKKTAAHYYFTAPRALN